MLEMCGLTVISVVADGCSTNRKFFVCIEYQTIRNQV